MEEIGSAYEGEGDYGLETGHGEVEWSSSRCFGVRPLADGKGF